jgi:hypothetical protein
MGAGFLPGKVTVKVKRRSEAEREARTYDLLIRRVCHASLLPGHIPSGLQGCRSLSCIVWQSFAVLCGQNEAIAKANGSGGGKREAPVPAYTLIESGSWSTPGPRRQRPSDESERQDGAP